MSYALLSDCRDVMAALRKRGHTVQSIVTDPPYHIGFMSKAWDSPDGIAFHPEVWKLCLDLLAPGGYLCAFGGSRTHHRLATAIEDAGFEVRDTLVWLHSQGFPKSLNVSAAIDRKLGYEREVVGIKPGHKDFANRSTRGHLDFKGATAGFDRPWMHNDEARQRYHLQTAPASPQARQWTGYGTNLKPSCELVCLARKPLDGTVAANVLKHGVGGLNIDGCRIPLDVTDASQLRTMHRSQRFVDDGWGMSKSGADVPQVVRPEGRFPSNFCHDGSDEVLDLFPNTGEGAFPKARGKSIFGAIGQQDLVPRKTDSGSAARFFFCAKASKAERNGSKHPTVKPVALMRWLVRLVTPPGGLVLDPFAGTGTTGEAARREGRDYILIEKDPAYFDDLKNRLAPQFIAERRLA